MLKQEVREEVSDIIAKAAEWAGTGMYVEGADSQEEGQVR